MLSKENSSSYYNPWGYPRMPHGSNSYTGNDNKSNSKKSSSFKSRDYKNIKNAVEDMEEAFEKLKNAKLIKSSDGVRNRIQTSFSVIETYAQTCGIPLTKVSIDKSISDRERLPNCDEVVAILRFIRKGIEIKEEFEELLRTK